MTIIKPIGPLEKQLCDLWQALDNVLHHPKNWFKLLSLRRRFDLNFILYKDIKIQIPKGQVPDCESCLEICCTGPNSIVSLRLRDIAALIDAGLGHHITHERSRLSILGDTVNEAQKNFSESIFSQVFPILKQDKTNTCSLLDENRLCSAYPAWPISCARYPFALDATNRVIFYAKGCGFYETYQPSEVGGRVRNLVTATIDSYNERIKDILLLHFAREELKQMKLTKHLRLEYL